MLKFTSEDYEKAKRVFEKVRKGKRPTLEELNITADPYQKVAHILAKRGLSETFTIEKIVNPKDFPEVLKISNDEGWSVAHELALQGYPFPRSPRIDAILPELKTKETGTTPLHVLAFYYPEIFVSIYSPKDKKLYTVPDKYGLTPAHIVVERGYFPFSEEDKEILLLPIRITSMTVLEIALLKGLITNLKDEELRNHYLQLGMTAEEFLKALSYSS